MRVFVWKNLDMEKLREKCFGMLLSFLSGKENLTT